MTPPALVYLGMGLIVARIILDGRQTRGFTWLNWLQYLVDAARIVLLWPLVLFVDKLGTWLKSTPVEPPYPVDLYAPEIRQEVSEADPIGGEKR